MSSKWLISHTVKPVEKDGNGYAIGYDPIRIDNGYTGDVNIVIRRNKHESGLNTLTIKTYRWFKWNWLIRLWLKWEAHKVSKYYNAKIQKENPND